MNFVFLMLKYLFPVYPLLRAGEWGLSRKNVSYLLRSFTDSISVYILLIFLPLVFLYENSLS